MSKRLIKKFSDLYREKVGELYPPTWGRDLKLFKSLLEQYSEERLERLLDIYFQRNRKIYSIPFFKVALSELIQIEKNEDRLTPTAKISDNENWRFA